LSLYVLPQYGDLDPAEWQAQRDRLARVLAGESAPGGAGEQAMARRLDAALHGIHGVI
jgi:hypothetical protein